MRFALTALLLLVVLAAGSVAASAPALGASAPAAAGGHESLARLGGFGGRGFGRAPSFGNRGFGSRGFGRRTRGRSFFRRILHALAIAYLLHLLFTTPGGLFFMVIVIGLIAFAVGRRRRRLRY
jgi:hypothetical protein